MWITYRRQEVDSRIDQGDNSTQMGEVLPERKKLPCGSYSHLKIKGRF
ncbi:hypothetical protein SEF58_05255 [Neomoorella humiferrea]